MLAVEEHMTYYRRDKTGNNTKDCLVSRESRVFTILLHSLHDQHNGGIVIRLPSVREHFTRKFVTQELH